MNWMIDLLLRVLEVSVVVGGVAGSVYASRLWLQAQKHLSLAQGKDEVIRLLGNNVEAWKSRFEAEHAELLAYRDDVHVKAEASNLKIIDLTNANAELRGKTDLSPVMQGLSEMIKHQAASMKEITAINGGILTALSEIGERINGHHPKKLTRKAVA
jgi:hypothetical protein